MAIARPFNLRKLNMMMKFQPPRGTRDFLPEDAQAFRLITEKIREIFQQYGYGEVITPAFEDFDLLAKKAGQEIENEMYVFTDKSQRKLGLRFDFTVPLCRVVSSNPSLPKPLKLYAIGNAWRYDRPQKGRWREFWQAGLELIGSSSLEADVEIIRIVSDCLKAVGISSFYFRINSRKIIDKKAKELGIREDKKTAIFRALDKLGKKGQSAVAQELKDAGIDQKKVNSLLDFLNEKDAEDAKDLKAVIGLLKERGIKDVRMDFSIVRGIDYYTGFVFETMVEGFEDVGSVASGGRYDNLIELYGGGSQPATGFGMGIDRILEIVKKSPSPPIALYIANVNESLLKSAIDIADTLREKGISCETDLMGRPLRNHLEYVNAKKIPRVLFVGEKEMKSKKFTVRDMKTGKEETVSLEKIAAKR